MTARSGARNTSRRREKARAELSAQVHRLQSEAQTWEDEKAVLLASLEGGPAALDRTH